MKKLILLALVSAAMTGRLLAQGAQAEMVKQRAKAVQQQNNVNQGIVAPPAAAPAVTPQPAAPPPPPRGIDPAQQLLIDKLQADLSLLKAGFPASPEQKQGLQDDVLTLAKGAVKPTKEMAAKLATDIATALAEPSVINKETAPLAKDINVVVNSLNLSPTQVQTFVNAAQKSLKTCGASDAATDAVVGDLKAMAADMQKRNPKLY